MLAIWFLQSLAQHLAYGGCPGNTWRMMHTWMNFLAGEGEWLVSFASLSEPNLAQWWMNTFKERLQGKDFIWNEDTKPLEWHSDPYERFLTRDLIFRSFYSGISLAIYLIYQHMRYTWTLPSIKEGWTQMGMWKNPSPTPKILTDVPHSTQWCHPIFPETLESFFNNNPQKHYNFRVNHWCETHPRLSNWRV